MRKLVSAFVTFVFTAGAGHLAYGRYGRAAAWIFVDAVLWSAMVASALACRNTLLWGVLAAFIVLRLLATIDLVVVSARTEARPSRGRVFLLWAALWLVAGAQASVIRADVVQAYRIPSASMAPTVFMGDHLFVNKRARHPKRGDIIVYASVEDARKVFLKRVIALAGDTIEIDGVKVLVNGKEIFAYPKEDDCTYVDFDELEKQHVEHACHCTREYREDGEGYCAAYTRLDSHPGQALMTVPRDSVYVLGDNRDNSNDSRFTGPIPLDHVKGTALFVWLAWEDGKLRWNRVGTVLR